MVPRPSLRPPTLPLRAPGTVPELPALPARSTPPSPPPVNATVVTLGTGFLGSVVGIVRRFCQAAAPYVLEAFRMMGANARALLAGWR